MVVYPDGRIVGTIGGGCVEAEMTWRARQVIDVRQPQLVSYELTPDQAGEDGLICGGRMEVFIEPIEGTPTLCLFGAGHVAQPLARMAKAAGLPGGGGRRPREVREPASASPRPTASSWTTSRPRRSR